MRSVFQEVWRVLRNDGTCWVNIADSYAAGKAGRTDHGSGDPTSKLGPARNGIPGGRRPGQVIPRKPPCGLKPKNLCLIPQRLALALQADGWYVRIDIVWEKPSCMPESVTDRPTRSHEYVWLLSKQPCYFFDGVAVREAASYGRSDQGNNLYARVRTADPRNKRNTTPVTNKGGDPSQGRNSRTVWRITSEPLPQAHFAAFPSALARRCILAGTSAHGVCSICGKPWVRVVEKVSHGKEEGYAGKYLQQERNGSGRNILASVLTVRNNGQPHDHPFPTPVTTGWRPTCPHDASVVPATVLDPFVGSGTTVLAAYALGRQSVGLDLSLSYLSTIAQPRLAAAMKTAQEQQAEHDAQPDLFAPPAPRWIQQPLFGTTP